MCAIYGFSGLDHPQLLGQMGKVLAHRGPDDEGGFTSPLLSMGNRRLSILDIAGGEQPVSLGSLVLCYNGEVYNYVELQEELTALGHTFETTCDSEVVLHAYAEWGEDCLPKLNGMFAIGIWNKETEELFVARDRSGQKPLYYWQSAEQKQMAFASEVKALLKHPSIPREANERAVDAYLRLRYVPEPETMFRDIFTLPAGHCLRWSADKGIRLRRWWEISLLPESEHRTDEEEAVEELGELLDASVARCLRSDVPVGSYLSGGVDSALLVESMRRTGRKVKTFSIGFGSASDETPQAAEAASLLGTEHTEVHCSADDLALLPQVIYQMDRPVGDALTLAFHKLAAAASTDLKVVLSGEGADECFAGYQFHKVISKVDRFSSLAAPAGSVVKRMPLGLLDKFFEFPAGLGQSGRQRLSSFLSHYSKRDLAENVLALRTLWDSDERNSLYDRDFAGRLGETWSPNTADAAGTLLDSMLKLQWDEWLQDWSLIRQDKNAMGNSLEVRAPFLDNELIDFSFKLSRILKVSKNTDKLIIRKLAATRLPGAIANRTKNPFYLPLDTYWQHPALKNLVSDSLNDSAIKSRGLFDHKAIANLRKRADAHDFVSLKQIMSLVILEQWYRIFIDGEVPA